MVSRIIGIIKMVSRIIGITGRSLMLRKKAITRINIRSFFEKKVEV
jgi:hypothetical protein